jgi:hypothetical protein
MLDPVSASLMYVMSQDTGLWGIYFVTDAYNQENMVFNIAQEWMRLCTSVTDFEVGIVFFIYIFGDFNFFHTFS